MIWIISLLFLVTVLFSKIKFEPNKKNLVSIETSKSINGFFTCLILISHFTSYVALESTNSFIARIVTNYIGQMMVASFLVFSGYGIAKSILTKDKYISEYLPSRIMKVYRNFFISIVIYLLYNYVSGIKFPARINFLSFLGWESIGNSNWYIFTIMLLYLLVYLLFNNSKGINKNVLRFTIVTMIYGFLIVEIKQDYWASTVLCFPAGMYLGIHENKILSFLTSVKRYILSIVILTLLIVVVYYLFGYSWLIYNLIAFMFIFMLILLGNILNYSNNVLIFISTYTFEIYIYQRLFFDLYSHLLKGNNIVVYFFVSVFSIFIFSFYVKKYSDRAVTLIKNKLFSK
ncbi:acyltransferase family protein [Erysipelothrix rhusiopathiae]|uniref:acyltransferase family protein n=1 Tax=Erysipelothrix rhusiopathiae TaxID=1648 RepID=UPI003AB7FAA5